MCIVTEGPKPTPTEYLPVLSAIQFAELRSKAATLSLAHRFLDPSHTLYNYIKLNYFVEANLQKQNVELKNSFNVLNEKGDSSDIFLIWFCALLKLD